MKITYFPQDDIIYIDLSNRDSVESEEIAPGVVVDFAEDGTPVGIEISNASKIAGFPDIEIANFPISELTIRKAA